jgi:CubicO group peptidase (beta-lactamase class C family)
MTRSGTPRNAKADWAVERDSTLARALDDACAPMNAPGAPGGVVAVLRGEQVVLLKGYGCANCEFAQAWTPDTHYPFYSLSKSMAAVVMLRLEQEGRLGLDDELQRHLSDFPRFAQPLRLRHLLTHTTGLWQDEDVVALLGMNSEVLDLDALYDVTRRQPALPYAPGSHFVYSDTAMRLAARVITVVCGQPFGAAMRSRLFEPAAMHSALHQGFEFMRRPHQASAYLIAPGTSAAAWPKHAPSNLLESSGDGGISGSLRDLIAYARFLRSAYAPDRRWIDRLVEPSLLQSALPCHYRTCFNVLPWGDGELWTHAGLYGKRLSYVPSQDCWIIEMRNAIVCDDALEDSWTKVVLDALNSSACVTPQTAQCRDEEAMRLGGAFVEPVSGLPLRVVASARSVTIDFLGDEGPLVRDDAVGTPCWRSQVSTPLRLALEPGEREPRLQFSDWPSPRPLQRVAPTEHATPAALAELSGTYHCSPFGALLHLRIHGASGRLRLLQGHTVETGAGYEIEPFATDLWLARREAGTRFGPASFSLRVQRDARGAVAALRLDTDSVRALEVVKLDLPPATPVDGALGEPHDG